MLEFGELLRVRIAPVLRGQSEVNAGAASVLVAGRICTIRISGFLFGRREQLWRRICPRHVINGHISHYTKTPLTHFVQKATLHCTYILSLSCTVPVFHCALTHRPRSKNRGRANCGFFVTFFPQLRDGGRSRRHTVAAHLGLEAATGEEAYLGPPRDLPLEEVVAPHLEAPRGPLLVAHHLAEDLQVHLVVPQVSHLLPAASTVDP